MSLSGRVYLITGSTDGIGKHTALRLAQAGGTVLVHGRNRAKGEKVVEELKTATGNPNIELFTADFSSLDHIRQMSREVHERHSRIDVLINNAGVWENQRILSQEGYEMTLAVNVLAPFLLTSLLLDLIPKGRVDSRILIVSSMTQAYNIDFSNLQFERDYSGFAAYGLSKLCDIVFSYELSDRLRPLGIIVNCCDPGTVNTNMLMKSYGPIGIPIEQADNEFYLATDPKFTGVTGKYFVQLQDTSSASISYDIKTRRRLWQIMEQMTGATYP
ncbi:retinol dehydrogenase 14-like [Saccoglossus kowalevskii]|uniref:Retinol dehydrogenase 14-like n=1 Tax=Saccoglossus kowalevskii TaxID=10224 RepID=A0A1L7H7G4_SACKO|nr:PREDICTED: retinol dehydrogenase 14-like [Saccoglossus kowalevskii]APU50777.1 retinol dehydrogenase 14-like protein 094 [Saccoglossus kowalevskii]